MSANRLRVGKGVDGHLGAAAHDARSTPSSPATATAVWAASHPLHDPIRATAGRTAHAPCYECVAAPRGTSAITIAPSTAGIAKARKFAANPAPVAITTPP